MIPFNHLGLIFKLFTSFVYPAGARKDLADAVNAIRTDAAVLDIGSGTGILTQFVRNGRADLRYVCLDPAPGMLKYVPGYAHKIEGNAEELPFRNQVFGVVLVGDALHHLSNPTKAITEMIRCLDSRGTLFIFDINPGTFMGRLIRGLEVLFNEPATFYLPEELECIFVGRSSFVKTRHYGWRYTIIASGFDKP